MARREPRVLTLEQSELVTGNIYDIPGYHELEASKESHLNDQGSCFIEAEKENIHITSRSSLNSKSGNAQDFENKDLYSIKHTMSETVCRKPFIFAPNLENNFMEPSFHFKENANSRLENSGVGNEMELTMIHNHNNLTISSLDSENFFESPKPKNCTIEKHHIVSTISGISGSHEASPSIKDLNKYICKFLESDRKKNSLKEQFYTDSHNSLSSLNSFTFNTETLGEKAHIFPAFSKNKTKFINDFYLDEEHGYSANYLLQNKENLPNFVFNPCPQGSNFKTLRHVKPLSDNSGTVQRSKNQLDKTKLTVEEMEITFLNPQAHSSVIEKQCEETGNKTKYSVHDMEVTCIDSLEASSLSVSPDSVFIEDDAMEISVGNVTNSEDLEKYAESGNSQNHLENISPNDEKMNKTGFSSTRPTSNLPYENIELNRVSSSDVNIYADKSFSEIAINNRSKFACGNVTSNEKCKARSIVNELNANCFGENPSSAHSNSKGKLNEYSLYTENRNPVKNFSDKESSQDEILNLDKTSVSNCPTDLIQNKENIKFSWERSVKISGSDLRCNESEYVPEDEDFKINDTGELEVESSTLDFSAFLVKPFHFDKVAHTDRKFMFQSSALDITCNTECSRDDDLQENFEQKDTSEILKHSHKTLQSPVENPRTQYFESDKMEFTCAFRSSVLSSINNCSSKTDQQVKFLENASSKLTESCRTHNYTSDKMELTCAVENNSLQSEKVSGLDIYQQIQSPERQNADKDNRFSEYSEAHNSISDKMELTCAHVNNTFQSINDNSLDTQAQIGDLKCQNLSKNFKLGENSQQNANKNNRFSEYSEANISISDKMELTCAHVNNTFQSINDNSLDTQAQIGDLKCQNLSQNFKLCENSQTKNFINDEMDLTCAVKNNKEFKEIFDINARLHDASCRETENCALVPENHYDELEMQHSVNIERDNVISNSADYEMNNKDQHLIQCSPEILPNVNERDCNLSNDSEKCLNNADKSLNKTFNSHEKEVTFAAIGSYNVQVSPFFQINSSCSSKSSTSRKQHILNLQKLSSNAKQRSFQISYSRVSLQSSDSTVNLADAIENISGKNKLLDSATANSARERIPNKCSNTIELKNIACNEKKNQVALKTIDISLKNVNDNLTPFDSNNTQKVKIEHKNHYSNAATPGAVYTLRKRRQQLSGKLIFSPEVTDLMKKAEILNLKHSFSEVKSNSPVRDDCRKSLNFNSFEMENSLTTQGVENVQSSKFQSFNTTTDNNSVSPLTDLNTPPVSNLTSFTLKERFSSSQTVKEIHSNSKCNQDISSIPQNERVEISSSSFNDSLQILPDLIFESSKFSMSETISKMYATKPCDDKSISREESILINPVEKNTSETSILRLNSGDGYNCFNNLPNLVSCSVFFNESKQKDPIFENSTMQMSGKKIENVCLSPKVKETSVFLDSFIQTVSSMDNVMPSDKSDLKTIYSVKDLNNSSKSMHLDKNSVSLSIAETSKKISLKRKILNVSEENSFIYPEKRSTNETLKEINDLSETDGILALSESLKKVDVHSLKRKTLNVSEDNGFIYPEKRPTNETLKEISDLSETDGILALSESLKKVDVPVPYAANDIISTKNYVRAEHCRQSEKLMKNLDYNSQNELMDQDLKEPPQPLEIEISCYNDSVNLENVRSKKNLEQAKMQISDYQEGNKAAKVKKQPESIEISTNMLNCTAEDIKPSAFSCNKIPGQIHQHPVNTDKSSIDVPEKSPCGAKTSAVDSTPVEMEVSEAIHRSLERTEKDVTMELTNECPETNNDIKEDDYSVSALTQDMSKLKLKFEEASNGSNWKLKTIEEDKAVFRLEWGVWLYRCVVFIYVDCENPYKLNISFEPCRKHSDEYTTLGYKFFQYLVNDKILPFSFCSNKMIEKLNEYSSVSERVESLMRNIMQVDVSEINTLSEDLNPLKFCVEILNENHMSKFLMTFYINLHTYPLERIVPEIKHLNCQVIYSQFGLAIHQNDNQARRRFVEWDQNEIAVVPDFHKRILFTDEAHFWLNGYVNKQNCRIWSEANPQVYVETPLHPEKLTVWCALWAGIIIGPYFKNDEGHNVTVNGDRYRAMITNFFIPELNNHDVQELWFQQDGATCHTARATINLLKDTFGDCLISRFGPVNWPPRSCDLTPLDYFLWGDVKSLIYADKPQTLDHLEDNIRRVIADIRPQMLEKVIENWTSRLDYIRSSPMPEIIFKMSCHKIIFRIKKNHVNRIIHRCFIAI
ncbi:uncharacterized protein TNCV_4621381 [Trichonephila clavipes]|nr:uncharacterized protein TNCV_4621381 [Trichonephila clavipes]